jgi:hypothetical protein
MKKKENIQLRTSKPFSTDPRRLSRFDGNNFDLVLFESLIDEFVRTELVSLGTNSVVVVVVSGDESTRSPSKEFCCS